MTEESFERAKVIARELTRINNELEKFKGNDRFNLIYKSTNGQRVFLDDMFGQKFTDDIILSIRLKLEEKKQTLEKEFESL